MISAYFLHLLIILNIYIILAISLQLAMGYGGLLNLGHIAFYCIGAYVSGLLTLHGWLFLPSFFMAGVSALIASLFLSLPTNRLKGDYLALITLGFTYIIYAIVLNWRSLTRGSMGLSGIPHPHFFGIDIVNNTSFLILVIIVVLISYFIINRVVNSDFGKVIQAVRDNELAVKVLGKSSFKVKSITLMISAFFAGIAGALYAHYITYIDPSSFTIMELTPLLAIVIIGGLASLRGTIIASLILILLPELLRFIGLPSSILGPARQIIFGLVLLLILVLKPKGFFGKVELK